MQNAGLSTLAARRRYGVQACEHRGSLAAIEAALRPEVRARGVNQAIITWT